MIKKYTEAAIKFLVGKDFVILDVEKTQAEINKEPATNMLIAANVGPLKDRQICFLDIQFVEKGESEQGKFLYGVNYVPILVKRDSEGKAIPDQLTPEQRKQAGEIIESLVYCMQEYERGTLNDVAEHVLAKKPKEKLH